METCPALSESFWKAGGSEKGGLTYPVIRTVPRDMVRDGGCGRWRWMAWGIR